MTDTEDLQADGYYDEADLNGNDELDLSFLDDEEEDSSSKKSQ